MAADDDQGAPVAVWYFLGATFVAALPMITFPDLPWWARVGTLVLALALIVGGSATLRRERRDEDTPTDETPADDTPQP